MVDLPPQVVLWGQLRFLFEAMQVILKLASCLSEIMQQPNKFPCEAQAEFVRRNSRPASDTFEMERERLWSMLASKMCQKFGHRDDHRTGLRVTTSRGCYEVASRTSLPVMRMAKAMKCMPLRVCGSRS